MSPIIALNTQDPSSPANTQTHAARPVDFFSMPAQLLLDKDAPSTDPSIDFPHACYHPSQPLALVSFDPLTYVVFSASMILASYALYYVWIEWRGWEHKAKTPADHYTDVMQALCYTTVIFTFGSYSHTFGWPMLVAYYVGLWCYGLLVEVPFLRISLPGWRTWSWRAWMVIGSAVLVIIGLAAYHIVLAAHVGILWPWYLGLFILAWAILFLGVAIAKIDKRWWSQRRIRQLRARMALATQTADGQSTIVVGEVIETTLDVQSKSPQAANDVETLEHTVQITSASIQTTPSSQSTKAISSAIDDPANSTDTQQETVHQRRSLAAPVPGVSSDTEDGEISDTSLDQMLPSSNARALNETIMHQSGNQSSGKQTHQRGPLAERLLSELKIHVHHWQIFMILAFFTRFQDIISEICAGLVLACFMQGGIAYGFDSMLIPKWTKFTG
jgi:hypothetical protein